MRNYMVKLPEAYWATGAALQVQCSR